MKRYIGPLLKLLLILAFLSRLDYVFGQPASTPERSSTAPKYATPLAFAEKKSDILLLNDSTNSPRSEKAKHDAPVKSTTLGEAIGMRRVELKASPKAFSSKTDLSFMLHYDSSYKLEILNMQGDVLKVLAEGGGQAGDSFSFRFKKENYPAGGYIARLIMVHEVTSVRFMLE